MDVPLNDLKLAYQALKPEIDAAVARVLERGWYLLGEELAAFETEFAAWCGARFGVGVANGTEAIWLALAAAGVEPGDEVLTVANAGVPPVAAVELAGARPVFCDVAPDTHAMDPERAAAAITPRTRAVLVVHLFGHPAELAPLLDLAARHGIPLIEDASQAHGATYRGGGPARPDAPPSRTAGAAAGTPRRVGAFGRAGAFSCYPTKNLGALGDAGVVVTDDEHLAERLRLLRQYGWRERYWSVVRGVNSRLDELQAAVLRVKLRHLDRLNAARRALAARYRAGLADLPGLELPAEAPWADHVYHLFVVQTDRRDALLRHLRARGVGAGVHYPVPAHLQPAYRDLGYRPGALPVTERLAERVLSLPLYPELKPAQVDYVIEQVRAFFGRV